MSIINEALKKIEKGRGQIPAGGDRVNLSSPHDIKKETKKAVNRLATRLVIVWFCAAALILVLILILIPPRKKSYVLLSSPENTTVTPETATVDPAQGEGATLPVQTKSAVQEVAMPSIFDPLHSRSAFQLSGTMFSNNEPVAIINNQIVKKGDTINGATVVSIGEGLVKLSYQGQELIVTAK